MLSPAARVRSRRLIPLLTDSGLQGGGMEAGPKILTEALEYIEVRPGGKVLLRSIDPDSPISLLDTKLTDQDYDALLATVFDSKPFIRKSTLQETMGPTGISSGTPDAASAMLSVDSISEAQKVLPFLATTVSSDAVIDMQVRRNGWEWRSGRNSSGDILNWACEGYVMQTTGHSLLTASLAGPNMSTAIQGIATTVDQRAYATTRHRCMWSGRDSELFMAGYMKSNTGRYFLGWAASDDVANLDTDSMAVPHFGIQFSATRGDAAPQLAYGDGVGAQVLTPIAVVNLFDSASFKRMKLSLVGATKACSLMIDGVSRFSSVISFGADVAMRPFIYAQCKSDGVSTGFAFSVCSGWNEVPSTGYY